MEVNKVGLIAGWGRFPICVAETLLEQGKEVYCCGIRRHYDSALESMCTEFTDAGVAHINAQMRFFRKHGVKHATMAGKIFKTVLFEKFGWLREFPDLTCLKYFYKNFITNTGDRKDDTLLGGFVDMYRDLGVELMPATDFAPQLLLEKTVLTKRQLSSNLEKDIRFGWELAKQMGGLDVGQSVAVKGRAVLAVEAVEGTDECIRRAGQLCPAGGFTVIKVAKPQQDMRFDVPTIGLGTLQTMRQAGGKLLVVEANKTILIDRPEVVKYANRHGIGIVAFDNYEMVEKRAAA